MGEAWTNVAILVGVTSWFVWVVGTAVAVFHVIAEKKDADVPTELVRGVLWPVFGLVRLLRGKD